MKVTRFMRRLGACKCIFLCLLALLHRRDGVWGWGESWRGELGSGVGYHGLGCTIDHMRTHASAVKGIEPSRAAQNAAAAWKTIKFKVWQRL